MSYGSRCLVVHPYPVPAPPQSRAPSALLQEAVGLAEAIALDVVEAKVLTLKKRTPKTLIGSGQVAECAALIQEREIVLMVVNSSLSPTQRRNLERACQCKVIDRTALILEIFGERAKTAEGKMQVELAALNYQKSQLVRSWTHLERQRGGFGFLGGPGESQIESDRRLIGERIDKIKKQLEKVARTRSLHRKTRRDTPLPLVALVGYTNAGKSTLFNRLTHAKVYEADQLFATLDPTIRRVTLPGGMEILLSDTVGFIADLPHELVAAFRATLEEVLEASLMVHVRDMSHPDYAAQGRDVEQVLGQLLGKEWERSNLIEVWNKVDAIEDISALPKSDIQHLLLSARTGDGCATLLHTLEQLLEAKLCIERDYVLPAENGKAIAWLYAHGHVTQQVIEETQIRMKVVLSPADAARFAQL